MGRTSFEGSTVGAQDSTRTAQAHKPRRESGPSRYRKGIFVDKRSPEMTTTRNDRAWAPPGDDPRRFSRKTPGTPTSAFDLQNSPLAMVMASERQRVGVHLKNYESGRMMVLRRWSESGRPVAECGKPKLSIASTWETAKKRLQDQRALFLSTKRPKNIRIPGRPNFFSCILAVGTPKLEPGIPKRVRQDWPRF